MAARRPRLGAGFTLVELVIVMSITSLLATVAFIGQQALRGRGSFDAAVDKAIQDLDYTRNFAMSNVGVGNGDDTAVVLAGAGLEFNDVHLTHSPPFPLEELEQIYATPTSSGSPDPATYDNCPPDKLTAGVCHCPAAQHPDDVDECFEDFFDLPDAVSLYNPTNPNITGELVDYINTGSGLDVCIDDGVNGSFVAITAACAASVGVPLNVYLKDANGYTATIQIDPVSGLAKRTE